MKSNPIEQIRLKGKLPTGLIVTGPDNGTTAYFPSIAERVNLEQRSVLIGLDSGQSPNLKTVLRCINQIFTNQPLEDDGDISPNEKNVRIMIVILWKDH